MFTVIKAFTLSECMEEMSKYVSAFEKTGDTNLVFCEDRLTLIAERAILRESGGTFQTSVTTFARFLRSDERAISKQGSVMVVGDVMTRLQRESKLQCFTTSFSVGNNAKCIYETLAQFSASEITPEVLREAVGLLPDDALKKKTADLALIYDGYLAFLRERRLFDESRYLSLLPSRIAKDDGLKNVNVFFLGYTAFTPQAREIVRAVCKCAKNVIGVFCCDKEDLYANRAAESFTSVCNEFGKTRTLDLGTPLMGEAEILRKGLFNPDKNTGEKKRTDNIRIFEAADKIAEAEYVAVQIRRATSQDNNLHYRDFAVLVPDIHSYTLSLHRAFSEYGIPYFTDEKRSLKSHPLACFLLDCLRVVKERFSPVSVQSLTQNVFFGESDEYRNYLLKFANYRGGAKREIKTGDAVTDLFDIEALQSGRERLLRATKHVKQRARGREYCNAIRVILEEFDAKNRLAELTKNFTDVAQKAYFAQIERALDAVLLEAEQLTGDAEMTVSEFAAVLQDGLDATEISLIPIKADAVFVGDIAQSRIEKVELLFALGMTEEVPYTAGDTAIVSDKEIERLAEVKTLLEPTVAEVNKRTRESVGLNLCTFLRELHLTYPLSADGSEPTVSEVFRYIDERFCGMDGKAIVRRKKHREEDFAYQCAAVAPAIRQLLLEKKAYEEKHGKSTEKYSSLYTALDKLSVTEKDDYLAERQAIASVTRGEELFFRDGKISPTALEGYFSCPFRNFVERGLKLQNREETAVLAMDTGNFVHALLELTAKVAADIATEEEMCAYAMREGAKLLQSPLYAMQADTASGTVFSEKLLKEGADVAVAAFRQIKNSDYIVEETEMNIATPDFHGKVDRVDGTEKFVRVIDYKTGSIDDKAVSYYTGRKLQMQLYMSAIKGERIPAGVFYFPASVDYTETDEKRFQMKGFLNGETEALLCGDKTLKEEGQSEFFPASLHNNARSKRVMDEQTFRDFLDYSVLVARQGCKELKDGFIAPTPYAATCDYCKYGGLCGFNREKGATRVETGIDPKTIAEIAKTAREGGEN
ncbi:MAG: exodeoxyribonuclease V subunit gamma [Clostridia bacterium]|nr:exodeoxyribonuclease V subunit gamma [Clostridia bacterium]